MTTVLSLYCLLFSASVTVSMTPTFWGPSNTLFCEVATTANVAMLLQVELALNEILIVRSV